MTKFVFQTDDNVKVLPKKGSLDTVNAGMVEYELDSCLYLKTDCYYGPEGINELISFLEAAKDQIESTDRQNDF